MVYEMHPVGEVQPVQVTPDVTVDALLDGLDTLGLLADGLVDPAWFEGAEAVAVADARRLAAAAAAYRTASSGAAGGGRGVAGGSAEAVAQFFAYVADTAGHDLVIQRLT